MNLLLKQAAFGGRRGFSLSFAALAPGAHTSIPGVSVARASSATVQTGTATLAHAAADEARVGRSSDGDLPGLLIEAAGVNAISQPINFAHAWWTLFGTASAAGSQSDPAGGSDAYRVQAGSGVNGLGETAQTAISGASAVTVSVWARGYSASQNPNTNLFRFTGATLRYATAEQVSTAWERVSVSHSVGAGDQTALVPVDGRDWASVGGVGAGARDVVVYGAQREASAFPTSLMLSPRAGDRVFRPGYRVSGRVGFGVTIRPLGARSDYSARIRVATLDPATWAEIDPATGQLALSVQGSLWESSAGATWAAGDTVEIWVEGGGEAQVSGASYRVNGGPAVSLGQSTAAQPSRVQDDSRELDLCCRGTSQQWDGFIESVRTSRPSWASAPSGAATAATDLPRKAVFCGNSLANSYGATAPEARYPAVVGAILGAGWTVENRGVNGWEISNLVSDAAAVTAQYSPLAQVTIAVAWELTNTLGSIVLYGGAASAQARADTVLAQWAAYVATLKSAGIYVVALTCLPRTDLGSAPANSAFEAARTLVNAAVRNNPAGIYGHRVSDVAALPHLQDSTNTTYFYDLVHLTDAGYADVAARVASDLQTVFP